MGVDIRKPVSHKFGIERPGASNDISTSSGNLDDESDDEDVAMGLPPAYDGSQDDDALRRLREARDAMEQHDLDRRRDYGTITNGDGPNALDVEERISAQQIHQTDFPIYDSDSDDEDEIEEARQKGGLKYHSMVAKQKAKDISNAVLNGLVAIIPKPRPTDVGDGGFTLGVPSWKQPGEIMKFKAPKGKRTSPLSYPSPTPIKLINL